MNFQQSPDQAMLRKSVAGTFARDGGAGITAALADLGVFGLLVGSENGGSALGLAEAVIVLQEAGRAGAGGSLAETLLMADPICRAMPHRIDEVVAGRAAVVAPNSGTLRRAGGRLRGTLNLAPPTQGDLVAAPIGGGTRVALLPVTHLEPTGRVR
ncbi:MAG: acyl-CoA dehydrogenase family protein, partial [Mesorhizobium sp.]|nr:acyl-CoA dehydrogenase family protein [Mesorhizobium sp.]